MRCLVCAAGCRARPLLPGSLFGDRGGSQHGAACGREGGCSPGPCGRGQGRCTQTPSERGVPGRGRGGEGPRELGGARSRVPGLRSLPEGQLRWPLSRPHVAPCPRISEACPVTAHGAAARMRGLVRSCPSTLLPGWWGVQASSAWQGPSWCRPQGRGPGPVSMSCAAVLLRRLSPWARFPGRRRLATGPRPCPRLGGQDSTGQCPPQPRATAGTWQTVPGRLGGLAEARHLAEANGYCLLRF